MGDRKQCGACEHWRPHTGSTLAGACACGHSPVSSSAPEYSCEHWEKRQRHVEAARGCTNCNYYDPIRSIDGWCNVRDQSVGDVTGCSKHERRQDGRKPFTINDYASATWCGVHIPINNVTCELVGDTRKEEKMSKKARKLAEKIEDAFGGKVEVCNFDSLDKYAVLMTLDTGAEVARGPADIGSYGAVAELLRDLKRRARRLLKVKK